MASNINAGLQQYAEVTNRTGLAGSITQDPFTPVEFGGNAAKSAYTTATSSGNEINTNVVIPAAVAAKPKTKKEV